VAAHSRWSYRWEEFGLSLSMPGMGEIYAMRWRGLRSCGPDGIYLCGLKMVHRWSSSPPLIQLQYTCLQENSEEKLPSQEFLVAWYYSGLRSCTEKLSGSVHLPHHKYTVKAVCPIRRHSKGIKRHFFREIESLLSSSLYFSTIDYVVHAKRSNWRYLRLIRCIEKAFILNVSLNGAKKITHYIIYTNQPSNMNLNAKDYFEKYYQTQLSWQV